MTSTEHLQKEIQILRETNQDLADRLAALSADYQSFELPGADSQHFTARHRTILKILHDAGGKTVSKDRIFDALYAANYSEKDLPGGKIVDVFICKIRRELKSTPWDIITDWGNGYSLKRRAAP